MRESKKESIINEKEAAVKKNEEVKPEKKNEEKAAEKKEKKKQKKKKQKPKKQKKEKNINKKKKKKKKKPTSRQHEIKVAGTILVSLLGAMLLYFIYFEVKGKDDVLSSKYNTRQQNMAQLIRKGDIVTSDGVVVATTQTREDGTEVRAYPYTNWYAHTVGYSVLGGYGLEDTQKLNLLTSHVDF